MPKLILIFVRFEFCEKLRLAFLQISSILFYNVCIDKVELVIWDVVHIDFKWFVSGRY